MLEYFTRAPSVLQELDPSLPFSYPHAWDECGNDISGKSGDIYLRDGKVYYSHDSLDRVETTWPTSSPAIALSTSRDNVYLVLCANLSQYLFSESLMELFALRDPTSLVQVKKKYRLNGYPLGPQVPEDLTDENSCHYRSHFYEYVRVLDSHSS